MTIYEQINTLLTPENAITVLEALGFSCLQEGEIIRACCELHKGDNPTSFVYSTTEHKFFCHVCKAHGDIIQLIASVLELNNSQAIGWLGELLKIDFNSFEAVEPPPHLKIIKNYLKRTETHTHTPYKVPYAVKKVDTFRQFKKETLAYFEMGYAEAVNRFVMPIYFKGELIGTSNRRVADDNSPKWLHYPKKLKRNDLLYNYPEEFCESIVICEGFFDVWCFYELGIQAVALMGTSLSDYQIKLLQERTTSIIVCLDGDKAGREGTKLILEKLKYRFDVKVITLPDGADCEDLNREELLEYYKKRI